jgi:hypothetical protein
VLIGLASLLFGESWNGLVLKGVIAVLAILTNLTAFQRIIWVWKHVRGVPVQDEEPKDEEPKEEITLKPETERIRVPTP